PDDSGGVSGGKDGHAATGDPFVGGWDEDSWTAVFAGIGGGQQEASGADLLPWWFAEADAAGLALHGLLLRRVRHESVPGESGIRRAVGQLPQRNRVRAELSRGAELRRSGGKRVQ